MYISVYKTTKHCYIHIKHHSDNSHHTQLIFCLYYKLMPSFPKQAVHAVINLVRFLLKTTCTDNIVCISMYSRLQHLHLYSFFFHFKSFQSCLPSAISSNFVRITSAVVELIMLLQNSKPEPDSVMVPRKREGVIQHSSGFTGENGHHTDT